MSDRTDRQDMTIRDVATASGIDRRTLTSQLKDGRFPNAFRATSDRGVAKGPWLIPVADLVAAGIEWDASPPVHNGDGPTSSELRAELVTVRAELAEERSRRLVAEALATERATAIEHLRDALKTMETLAAATTPEPPEPQKQQSVNEEPRRPRLRGQWLR
jgi:hypothetical protein